MLKYTFLEIKKLTIVINHLIINGLVIWKKNMNWDKILIESL